MELMTLKEMLFYKHLSGLSCEEIAKRSGVPLSTVQKVFSLTTTTPRNKTLLALGKAFEEFSKDKLYLADSAYEKSFYNSIDQAGKQKQNKKTSKSVSYDTDDVENTPVDYVNDGIDDQIARGGSNALNLSSFEDNTVDDYLALPEGTRVELIDGVFYDMAAPSYLHTQIASQIWKQLDDYIYYNKGKCSAAIAPTDVQLDCDDKTIVQPDLLVTCDKEKITSHGILGAPDFIVEIISDSNWYNDVFRKRVKYQNAGVREYWIVYPNAKEVQVYFFEKSDKPARYSFSDAIPVNIWDGKCKVDFKYICDRLSDYIS